MSILGSLLVAIAAPVPAPAVPLVCNMTGMKYARGLSPANVCLGFRAAIEKKLGRPVRLMNAAQAGTGEWVRVEIRFSRPDTASATLTRMRGGNAKSYPEQSISVSDRPMSQFFVDQLARAVAAQIG